MSSSAFSSRLHALMKKTAHHDKDERFMCCSDLCSALEAADCPPLDPPLQLSLSRALLPLLIDPSVDVQTISVKALGLLTAKISPSHQRDILEQLTHLTLDPLNSASRDVYTIGLRICLSHIASASPVNADLAIRCLTLFTTGLASSPTPPPDVAQAALDVCHSLLTSFASLLPPSSLDPLLDQLLRRLTTDDDPATQKRLITTLGALTPLLSDRLFNVTMEAMIRGLKEGGGGRRGKAIYVYLQSISTISASAGSRISRHLKEIVEQLERFCMVKGEEGGDGRGGGDEVDGDEGEAEADVEREQEVRVSVYEAVLSAFESLLQRCTMEVTPYVPSIVSLSLAATRYDPNWAGGSDDADLSHWGDTNDGESMTDDDGGEQKRGGRGGGGWDDDDEGEVDAGVMDDDNEQDDGSWKVRRAALRCLQALITSKPDLFSSSFFSSVFDVLMERLKEERDANVQLAVLDTIAAAVRECVVSAKEAGGEGGAALPASAASSHVHALLLQANLPIPVHTRPSLSELTEKLPLLFSTTLTPHLRLPLPARRATLGVWKQVIGVMQGGCDVFLPTLLPTLTSDASHPTDVRLRTDGLLLLRLTLELHPPHLSRPYLHPISHIAVHSMSLSLLKAKAEALRLSSTLLTLQPDADVVRRLYDAVQAQLIETDVDAEVKEAALACMATLLSLHHQHLPPSALSATLPIFHQRLSNEVTRLSALRAITRLTLSPSLPLTPILPATLSSLLSFLRKDNAVLRQETLTTLLALCRTQAARAESMRAAWTTVVRDVEGMIDERDVYLSTLVMDTIRETLSFHTAAIDADDRLIVRLMQLLQSPLLQGGVLTSLTDLFTALVSAAKGGGGGYSYEALVDRLSRVNDRVNDKQSSSTLMATAQCISAITAQATPSQRRNTVVTSLTALNPASATASNTPTQQLALYVLGGIGHDHDLSTINKDAFSLVAATLTQPSDGVKQAAAWSLGSLTTGNLPLFLPLLLHILQSDTSQLYLALTALLTVIQTASPASADAAGLVEAVAPLLWRLSESGEEGVRAMVSDCIGGLTLMDPQKLLPQLIERVRHSEAKVREVVITALRHSIPTASSSAATSLLTSPTHSRASVADASSTSQAASVASLQLLNLLAELSQQLPSFFPLLSDPVLPVQKQALLTITSLTHSQPSLLQPLLPQLLPLLYPPLTPVPSHVRVVDLGPFKHRVDDGLPLRQAALTALSTVFCSLHVGEEEVREWVRRGVRAGMAGEVGEGVASAVWEEVERLAVRYEKVMLGEVDGLVTDMMRSIREQLKLAKESNDAAAATAQATGGGAGGGGAVGGGGGEGAGRARDVLRICVRALLALQRMRGVEGHGVFQEFYARVLKTQMLVAIMQDMKVVT